MFFTQKDAEAAAKAIGLDFSAEKFTVDDLLAGMNAELRHGTKAGSANVTNDDPTMTAKLAVSNLRVSPSYYSQRVGKSAWERSLAKGVQHRGVRTEFKTIEFALEDYDEEEGTFSGYGAVFSNIDSGGDIIEPGAFTKTIAEGVGRVKILSGHNESLLPIGKPLELREDANGLFLKAKISDTTLGRDVRTLIKDGVLCELSIGYDPVVFDYDEAGIRHLREVKSEATERIKEAARDVEADIKAGRKISAARLKSLTEASTSMKAAAKLLDKVIAEARNDDGKGADNPEAQKSQQTGHHFKLAPTQKKTIKIIPNRRTT